MTCKPTVPEESGDSLICGKRIHDRFRPTSETRIYYRAAIGSSAAIANNLSPWRSTSVDALEHSAVFPLAEISRRLFVP